MNYFEHNARKAQERRGVFDDYAYCDSLPFEGHESLVPSIQHALQVKQGLIIIEEHTSEEESQGQG